jgi:hypothetical protein
MPIIDDIYLEKFGKLTIIITDEGVFKTINDSSVNYEFIITIRSLDSNLISHIMYHHCTVGHDMWT